MSLGIPIAVAGTAILAWFDQFNGRRLPALLCYGLVGLGVFVAFAESAFFEDALLKVIAGGFMFAVFFAWWWLLLRARGTESIGLGDVLIYTALVLLLPNSGNFALFLKTLFYSTLSHAYFAILSLPRPELRLLLTQPHALVPHIFVGLIAALVIP